MFSAVLFNSEHKAEHAPQKARTLDNDDLHKNSAPTQRLTLMTARVNSASASTTTSVALGTQCDTSRPSEKAHSTVIGEMHLQRFTFVTTRSISSYFHYTPSGEKC